MSVPSEIEQLNTLGDVKVKGNLSIEDLVRRQIDRCNMTISSADPETFNANVRALMKHLPGTKYQEILDRGELSEDEGGYNTKTEHYEYNNTCGHNIGTPKNPFVTVPNHPEWEFLLEVPKPYRERHMDEISIISPVLVEGMETDYEKLYRIVLEAFEERGLTWNVVSKTAEMGKIKDRFGKEKTHAPKGLVNIIEDAIIKALIAEREKDSRLNDVTFSEIIEDLRYRVPATPVMGPDV